MSFDFKLKLSLLSLRLGVFVVMFMWTLDKFINPSHASKVYAKFYFIPGLTENMSFILGSAQLILVLAFLLGVKKKFSYGLVLLLHTISTFSTFEMYFNPWGPRNLLFFAAWPMLAACLSLFLLRDKDTLFTSPVLK